MIRKAPLTMSPPSRRSALRPSVAIGLVALAAVAWGAVLMWQARTAPAQRHIDAAIEYTHQRLGKEAEQEWRAALRLDPNNADAWEQLGELNLSTQDWPAAVAPFRQLLRLRPNAPHVYERLAVATLRSGDEISALKYAEEELKREPNNLGALTIAALLLQDTGDDAKRLECLRRLTALQPDDKEALQTLAQALVAQRQYAEAQSVIAPILQRDPINIPALELRGEARMESDFTPQGKAQAEADFKRVLALNPKAAVAHFYLGKLYRREGRFALALPHLEAAARNLPDRAEVYFELAGLYARMGRSQEATHARQRFNALHQQADLLRRLEERCAADPNDFEDRRQRGLLALQSGDYRRASNYLHQAQQLRPNDVTTRDALQRLATALRASGP
jgi:tetratricopeptide (TPR) repeat protein